MKRIVSICVGITASLLNVVSLKAQDSLTYGFIKQFHSDILKQDREIMISLPPGYDTAKRNFPVIYLTDAEINFQYFTGIVSFMTHGTRGSMPPMIVVGIANKDRTYDLTPTKSSVKMKNGKEIFANSGGAGAFLEFIHSELKPFIQKNYNKYDKDILIGHSFGGLTALYCLLNHPDYFNDYVANDPSIWWDNGYIAKLAEDKFKSSDHKFQNHRLFISHSGAAKKKMGDHFGANAPEANASFANQLKTHANDISYKEITYPNESHGSVSLPANIDALRYLFENNQPITKE